MASKDIADVNLDRELNDTYHGGHLILETFRKKKPEDICQIQGDTNESETFHSVLNRTIRLARSLKNFGLKSGDVIVVAGINHLDVKIPLYAGMMNGLPVAGVDPSFKYGEIKTLVDIAKPKIVFCDHDKEDVYKKVVKDLVDTRVVTFKKGKFTMEKLIDQHDDKSPIDGFKPASFDPEKTFAWLVSTSGSTGVPKLVAITHAVIPYIIRTSKNVLHLNNTSDNGKQKIMLLLSPVQWITGYMFPLGAAVVNTAVLMTATPTDIDHVIDLINKYRPNTAPGSPTIYALILKSNKPCDLTCFDSYMVGGAKVYKDLYVELKARSRPGVKISEGYGLTEAISVITISDPENGAPIGSCGTMSGCQVKLVDPNGKEITEPNIPGELLYKGPMFSEYYNNPEETALAKTEDGWLKTGDQLYRDEKGNYFFVERIKMLIKFRSNHIIPTELEEVIRTHPEVVEVCVTSIDHPTDQQWPVALVKLRPGARVTAEEIKNVIADNLSDAKKLRGGVIFVDDLPRTSTGKVARMEARRIAQTAVRE